MPGTHLHKATQMLMLNLGHCFHNTVKSMKEEGEVSVQKYSLIINICFEPEVTLNYTVLLFSNNSSMLTLTFKVCNELLMNKVG